MRSSGVRSGAFPDTVSAEVSVPLYSSASFAMLLGPFLLSITG